MYYSDKQILSFDILTQTFYFDISKCSINCPGGEVYAVGTVPDDSVEYFYNL